MCLLILLSLARLPLLILTGRPLIWMLYQAHHKDRQWVHLQTLCRHLDTGMVSRLCCWTYQMQHTYHSMDHMVDSPLLENTDKMVIDFVWNTPEEHSFQPMVRKVDKACLHKHMLSSFEPDMSHIRSHTGKCILLYSLWKVHCTLIYTWQLMQSLSKTR